MKKLWSKLNIVNISVALVAIILVMVIVNFLFLRSNFPNILNPDSSNQSNEGILEDGDGPPDDSSQIDYVTKKIKLLDLMPYYSDHFNVTYHYGEDEFTVILNPASTTTREDVLKWFTSFPEVKRPELLNIKFVDPVDSGAPVTVN
jgi:hypothetical protein